MAELIFYQSIVPLDPEKHARLKLAPLDNFQFAAGTNSVPLVAMEFLQAAKEYPIVFAKGADGQFMPIALLGVLEGQNLFVDAAGKWSGRYIPGFIRRYPFAPAGADGTRMVVCIDEHAACLQEAQGEAIFTENGDSPLLQRILAVLQDYHLQAERTQAFCKMLTDYNLLTESNARIPLPDGSPYQLSGFHVVDEKRLQVLDKERVNQLFNSGELGLLYAHLMSLSNLHHLAERLHARTA